MNTGIDLAIYQGLYQQKKLTEKYVGIVELEWLYSEVHYTAECTIGVPFDLFDKTITGVLQVDEVLSIEEIGGILGMNLMHNPEKQLYRDSAEYDILRMALDNLKNHEMIETGDIYYSACKLTSIGREYAQKGRKFRIQNNKAFSLFYDHTTEQHLNAKNVFQKLKGVRYERKEIEIEHENYENYPELRGLKILDKLGLGGKKNNNNLKEDFDFLDEDLMKIIAEKQAVEVYDFEKGNSFTNPKINFNKSSTYILNVFAILLYDLANNQINIVAYETSTKTLNESFSDWLNENIKNQILEQFETQNRHSSYIEELPNAYIQAIKQKQNEFDFNIEAEPEQAFVIAHEANYELGLIDLPYFWNNLNEFNNIDTKEFWFFLSDPNEKILSVISKSAQSNAGVFSFVIIDNQSLSENIEEQIENLITNSKKLESNLFIVKDGIRTFDNFKFWQVNDQVYEFEECEVLLPEGNFTYKAIKKLENTLSKNNYQIFKAYFAEQYLPYLKEHIEDATSKQVDTNTLNKELILSYDKLDYKARIFTELQHYEEILQQVYHIDEIKSSFVDNLKEQHKSRLLVDLSSLKSDFEKQEFSKLEHLNEYSDRLTSFEKEFFEEYNQLVETANQLKTKIIQENNRIKDEVLAKTYIIDTNVFIEEPEIISKIEKKHNVVISHTVINELDKLKQRKQLRENAAKAIAVLNKLFNKDKRIKTARANINLLGEDYRQNSPDNRILSVASIYVDKNPVLLTSDNGLQLKAKSINIPTISLKDFLKPNQVLPKIDFRVIFERTLSGKNGEKRMNDFYNTIKKIQPEFNFKDYGYNKLRLFIQSIPELEIYNNIFIKLKNK